MISLALLLLASASFLAAPAHAHHGAPGSAGGLAARTRIGLEVEIGSYTLDLDGGYWLTACLGAEVALGRQVAVTGRLPTTYLANEQRDDAFGLGDGDLGVRVLVLESEDFSLAAGLIAAFPTGDPAFGIGAGHFELSPYVVAASSIDALAFQTGLAYRGSIGASAHAVHAGADPLDGAPPAHSHDAHPAGDAPAANPHAGEDSGGRASTLYALAYHADHEIVAAMSATYTIDIVFFMLSGEVAVALVPSERWGVVRARAGAGLVVGDAWRFHTCLTVPIDPPSGPNWSAMAGLDWLL